MGTMDDTGKFLRGPNTQIRESLAALHVISNHIVSDIRELKQENAGEFSKIHATQQSQDDRLKGLERKQVWVQAWAAGAFFILGGIAWAVSHIPGKAWIALAQALSP